MSWVREPALHTRGPQPVERRRGVIPDLTCPQRNQRSPEPTRKPSTSAGPLRGARHAGGVSPLSPVACKDRNPAAGLARPRPRPLIRVDRGARDGGRRRRCPFAAPGSAQPLAGRQRWGQDRARHRLRDQAATPDLARSIRTRQSTSPVLASVGSAPLPSTAIPASSRAGRSMSTGRQGPGSARLRRRSAHFRGRRGPNSRR